MIIRLMNSKDKILVNPTDMSILRTDIIPPSVEYELVDIWITFPPEPSSFRGRSPWLIFLRAGDEVWQQAFGHG